MSPVTILGRPEATPTDVEWTVRLPREFAAKVDEHLANRLDLEVTADNRDEVIFAALRAHIDFWPEEAPPGVYRVDGQDHARMRRSWRRDATPTRQESERMGPAASGADS
jgi:hypothetical protein